MKESYYKILGLELPVQATVKIDQMPGLGFYIQWVDCATAENLLYTHLKNRSSAQKIVEFHGWVLPGVTKVCFNPHCDAVFHNTPKTGATKCLDCGGRIMEINEKTFQKKYAGWFFQYDYNSHEFLRR
jgi:hypothetical protein